MIKQVDIRFDAARALKGGRDAELDVVGARLEIQPLQLVRREDQGFSHCRRRRCLLLLLLLLFHFLG